MANYEEIITYSLFFIGLLISLLIPLPIKEEYRLFIIATIILTFIIIILSRFETKLKDKGAKFEELDKRFKTMEELNDIRLDIREIKRKVFK